MKISKELKFVCVAEEFSGVKKIAKKVCEDVHKVFDFEPELVEIESLKKSGILESKTPVVIFGTCEKSTLIPEAEKLTLIQTREVFGKRESYIFTTKGNVLFITGSDKRGTIYGLFHLSELIGVSPLVDWCNILPAKKESFELEEGEYVSKEPSVKYRGFFINDEWPAFGNWANHNFGGINAKLYEHVFELLLRLKGNYLWPAMWASRFSDDGPGLLNAELADELGVIMGTSHHEPCCRAGEEYKYLRGKDSVYGDAWNFRSNEKGITRFWEDGLKRNGHLENVITVGMRGEADTAIMQNATLKDNINLLRDVLKTQNRLIKQYVNDDLTKVPRMLALYKEVEPYFYGNRFTKGLMNDPELEGVTLMLCDDNHGNLRTVPTEKMRKHNGGYGMYYHFDYHGWPYSYEWVNTTALPKVKEQMCAAYEFGIRELWIVNVGDILTNEFPLSYFLDLAYDYEKYSDMSYSTQKYTAEWVERQFPGLSAEQVVDVNFILNTYTKLAHQRRTECLKPDTYHPVNFMESDRMLALAQEVIAKAEKLDRKDPGLFAQVIFPALGNMNILRMQLYSGKNKWLAEKGILAANDYAEKVKECIAYDKALVSEVDKVADGKYFAHGWSEHFGFINWCEAENQYPVYTYVEPTRKRRICAWVDGQDFTTSGQDWTFRTLFVDDFKNPDCKEVRINVGTCNSEEMELQADMYCIWLNFEVVKGNITQYVLKIDRNKLDSTAEKTTKLTLKGKDEHGAKVLITVEIDANVPELKYAKGTFVQTGKYISMEAVHFTSESGWNVFEDYGKTAGSVKAYPVTATYPKAKNAPFVEYNFVCREAGVYAFDFFLNPSNPAYKNNKLQFVAEINGVKLLKNVVDSKTFAVGDNQQPWGTDVANNIRTADVYAECKKGMNTLKVYPVTPNIVLEKIVVHSVKDKMPVSYLGAPETYRVQ